ncbi:MAG: hypothetical protein ACK5MV_11655 [Aminipila sp.]
MELNDLINQIAVRVAEKISAIEEKGIESGDDSRPKLLILSECHSNPCHDLMSCPKINESYNVLCALSQEYSCQLDTVDTVVIRSLSLSALTKIAQGIADTPFTEMAVKAILLGKKIFIPIEETEIYSYRETAPKLYYGMMMRYIEQLKNAGVYFCNINSLSDDICSKQCLLESNCHNGHEGVFDEKSNQVIAEPHINESSFCEDSKVSVTINKRVITERDIRIAYEEKAQIVCIKNGTIITDLAKEYAGQRGISFSKS